MQWHLLPQGVFLLLPNSLECTTPVQHAPTSLIAVPLIERQITALMEFFRLLFSDFDDLYRHPSLATKGAHHDGSSRVHGRLMPLFTVKEEICPLVRGTVE